MDDFFGNLGAFAIVVIIIVFVGSVLGFVSHHIMYYNEPPAIEVYRGNTTLEITYRDGVPIDSVVVYKSNK